MYEAIRVRTFWNSLTLEQVSAKDSMLLALRKR